MTMIQKCADILWRAGVTEIGIIAGAADHFLLVIVYN